MWYVIDEFGFVVGGGYFTREMAEEMRDVWEQKNGPFDIKYEIEFREE